MFTPKASLRWINNPEQPATSMKKIDNIDLVNTSVRPLVVQAPVVRLVSDLAIGFLQQWFRCWLRVLGQYGFHTPGLIEISFEPLKNCRHVGFVLVDQELIEISAA